MNNEEPKKKRPLTAATLAKVETVEDLQAFHIGNVLVNVTLRGGYIGFRGVDVAERLRIPADALPGKFGAHCNYLGGGIRGGIVKSDFDPTLHWKKGIILDALADACARVYKTEELILVNDRQADDPDDDWNEKATAAAREAGIKSAY